MMAPLVTTESADSVPTSNLVCTIKEVAIRTALCIAGLSYYTCNFTSQTRGFGLKRQPHSGERRKCLIPSFSPFPTFVKPRILQGSSLHDTV